MIKITGNRYKAKKVNTVGRMVMMWVYQTDRGPMSVTEMAIASGVHTQTINTRINRYGATDPIVFSPDSLPKGGNQKRFVSRPERNPESIRLGTWEMEELQKQSAANRLSTPHLL